MPFCAHCGSPTGADAAFCTQCGRRIEPVEANSETTEIPPTPDPAMTQPFRTQPATVMPPMDYVQGTRTPPHNSGDPIDVLAILGRLVDGDWRRPALVAATAVGVAGVLSTLIALLVKPTDFGLDHSLTLVAWLTTGAFGADLDLQARAQGSSVGAHVTAAPLTVTVLALSCAALVFRRLTRHHPNVGAALFDALRAAVIVALTLTLLALLFRSGGKEFGRGWGNDLAHFLDVRVDFAPGAVSSFLGGFLLVLLVLTGATLMRSDWWPDRLRRAADLLTAPAYGVASFALLLPVAGLIGLVLALLTGDTVQESDPTDDGFWSSVGLLFALLANGGFWFLGLGSGASFGARGESGPGTEQDVHHLAHYAGDAWGLWLAPVVLVAVVVLATWAVVRRAKPEELVRDLVLWVLAVLLTGPVWTYLSGLHAGMTVRGFGKTYTAHGTIGVTGWQVTLLLTALAAAVSAGFLWRAGRLDGLADLARSLSAPRPVGPPPPPPPPPA